MLQQCSSLYDPMDCSLPGFSFHEILQVRTLEWVATSFSRGSSWSRDQTSVSCIAGGFFTDWDMREASGSLSGDRDITDGLVKKRSLGWTLTHRTKSLWKEEIWAQKMMGRLGENAMWRQRIGGCIYLSRNAKHHTNLQKQRQGRCPAQLTPPEACENDSCCINHPICGTILWQP